jgi:hypothetical protein
MDSCQAGGGLITRQLKLEFAAGLMQNYIHIG